RRADTFVNILTWGGFKLDAEDNEMDATLGEGLDFKLAMRAESYIRNAMLFLWKRFDKSVASIRDGTPCRRASEGQRRTSPGDFDVSIPASKCKNRECNNANFLQSNLPLMKRLKDAIQQLSEGADKSKFTSELKKSLEKLTAAIANPFTVYDYK